uniref:hypothetical protein n=1 Tax=uncultured Altererythrobacter sp. TaxID=500840 RepID=UPI00262D843C|nr:hypothetical protein [uncultured Altererythrobacter sp.]
MERARGIPVLIEPEGQRSSLERINLGLGNHNEDWLQALLHAQPEVLPIAEIEPGFGEPIAVAREIPCGHGIIDNLYLTPSGDIVLVEAKLWRNSEMRREVVAQALDYVSALTGFGYDDFQAAIARSMDGPARLYDLFADHPEALEEADLIDAVSRNLSRGRMLVMVVGDGIRTETEALTNLLQSHAGAHFTFALVELATWRTATGAILAVPDLLTKTVMIERGVVRLSDAGVTIEPAPVEAKPRAQSISMRDFMTKMAEVGPDLPSVINRLLDALEPMGVYPDLKASLNLKADLPSLSKPANFGYIDKTGKFWCNPAAWGLPERVWRPYFQSIADMIGGYVIDEEGSRFVAISGRSAPRINDLVPAHHDEFVSAIADAIRALQQD